MSTILEQIQDELKVFESKKKSLVEQLRQEFPKILKPIFDIDPALQSFGWTQYTPYFCDGDTCYFRVNTYDISINGYHEDDDIDENDEQSPLIKDETIKDLIKILESVPEEFMEDLFGDHIEVTVHRDGKIEKKEYEHD